MTLKLYFRLLCATIQTSAKEQYFLVILLFSLTILQNDLCLFSTLKPSGSQGLQHRTLQVPDTNSLLGTVAVFSLDPIMTNFTPVFFMSYKVNLSFILLSAKPPRQFSCQIRLDNEFVPPYREISSPESLALISELNRIFVPFFRRRFVYFLKIVYKRFFRGSIGMDFDILFRPTSNVSNISIVEAFKEGNSTKELASLTIIGGITVTEQPPVTETTVQSPSAVPTGISLSFVVSISVFFFFKTFLGRHASILSCFPQFPCTLPSVSLQGTRKFPCICMEMSFVTRCIL